MSGYLYHSSTVPARRVQAASLWLTPLRNTETLPGRMIRPSIKTEIFVCDQCGNRKRLPTSSRHWCDVCNQGSPVEMRPSRVKLTRSRSESSGASEVRRDRY
jgi:hypothetical protein